MALRAVSCLSPQSSVPHHRPSFFTLGAELLNGLVRNGSWAVTWAELQPSLPVPGQGQPEPCPSAACCWEGKVPVHCELQLPNLDVAGRAVLSWHWADNSWVLPQSAQSQHWLCCCRLIWTANKIPRNFISCQRSNPDNPLPGMSVKDHWVSPL